eukprot:TRINITY_DN970_c0_g1_i3.p1 TRINITY_DN970_c0_g1~~TRINITY_DN970_c0_g1_i3.p1  ORF type:complete len:388 (+),score=102.47 TRINITY_DN970_c0_g1_i3:166-1164(+)
MKFKAVKLDSIPTQPKPGVSSYFSGSAPQLMCTGIPTSSGYAGYPPSSGYAGYPPPAGYAPRTQQQCFAAPPAPCPAPRPPPMPQPCCAPPPQMPQPQRQLLKCCAPPPPVSYSQSCCYAAPAAAMPSAACGYYSYSSAPQSAYSPPPQSRPIVQMCGSDGLWKPSSSLMGKIGFKFVVMKIPDCIKSIPNAINIFTTAVVCVFLRKKYQTESSEWGTVVSRALALVATAMQSVSVAVMAAAAGVAIPATKCSKGHPLAPMTLLQLANENTGYSSGFVCDLCYSLSGSLFAGQVNHCTACGYDVCPSCTAGQTPGVLYLARALLLASNIISL